MLRCDQEIWAQTYGKIYNLTYGSRSKVEVSGENALQEAKAIVLVTTGAANLMDTL